MLQKLNYKYLDLLRFFSATIVVCYHFGVRGGEGGRSTFVYSEIAPVAKYGFLGVELFFIISGFVICLTVMRSKPWDFFISRAVRLYPCFWVCCTVTYVVTQYANYVAKVSWVDYLANMLLVSGFIGASSVDGVYWSLFVEIRFYALVFVILWLFGVASLERWVLGWVALSLLNGFYEVRILRVLFLTEMAPLFASGMLMYFGVTRGFNRVRLSALIVCFVLASRHLFRMSDQISQDMSVDISRAVCFCALLAGYLLVYLCVTVGRGATSPIWMRQMGSLTYPLYLLHQNFGFILMSALSFYLPRLAVFSVTVATVLVASYLIAVHVEPAIQFRLRSYLNGLRTRVA